MLTICSRGRYVTRPSLALTEAKALRIAFRTDVSFQIGTGHFQRCLTLADALFKPGTEIRFCCRHLPSQLRTKLQQRGYQVCIIDAPSVVPSDLGPPHAEWLGTSQLADAASCKEALSDGGWDLLVVDHYAIDERWEREMRPCVKKIFVIDDLADRVHDCDWLLDQNYSRDAASRYLSKVPAYCRCLIGPRYALLRKEFTEARNHLALRAGPVSRVLLFFGGVDKDNLTGRALHVLAAMRSRSLRVDVVIGDMHPFIDEIRGCCCRHDFECHIQTDRMAMLMAQADLAIGAGGTAVLERWCLGLPAIAFATAENQMRQVGDAAREGLLYAPDGCDTFEKVLAKHLPALLDNMPLREHMSCRGMAVVDGLGLSRVAALVDDDAVQIRPACLSDSREIFDWRNHPDVRRFSGDPGVIPWEIHEKWFEGILSSVTSVLLIGYREMVPIGVVRYDFIDSDAWVSIYLVPGQEKKGLGRKLLLRAEIWLKNHRGDIRKIRARIMAGNGRSRALFEGSGYHEESASFLKELQP